MAGIALRSGTCGALLHGQPTICGGKRRNDDVFQDCLVIGLDIIPLKSTQQYQLLIKLFKNANAMMGWPQKMSAGNSIV